MIELRKIMRRLSVQNSLFFSQFGKSVRNTIFYLSALSSILQSNFLYSQSSQHESIIDVLAAVEIRTLGTDEEHRKVTHANILKYFPNADLERYPVVGYRISKEFVKEHQLKHGEKIPEEILEMPIRLMDSKGMEDTVYLKDYINSKYLVLDFWVSGCAPCVKCMDKWNDIYPFVRQKVQVFGVHMDFEYSTQTHIERFGWNIPQIIGREAYILNAFLLGYHVIGPSVWISDGKIFGVTGLLETDDILNIIEQDYEFIPKHLSWLEDNSQRR